MRKINILLSMILFLPILSNSAEPNKSEIKLNLKDLSEKQKINLLNKIGYGISQKDLNAISKTSYYNWIEEQLKNEDKTLRSIELKNTFGTDLEQDIDDFTRKYKEIDFVLSDVNKNKPTFDLTLNYVNKELDKRIDYAINSENRINEMLVWFWFNHFNIGPRSQNVSAIFLDNYENKIRKHSLGKFKNMLSMISHHPAMLYYLDNAVNVYRKEENKLFNELNENYAREFLELHTMGVNNGYTQKDVQELAKILSGHGMIYLSNFQDELDVNKINKYSELEEFFKNKYKEDKSKYVLKNFYLYRDDSHFKGDKVFLNTKIKSNSEKELDEVIELVSHRKETAYFLSKKLAVFFMNDNPSENLIKQMADTYIKSDTDIKETLKTLFYSKEFILSLDKPSKLKDPYTYSLSTMKTVFKQNMFEKPEFKKDIVGFLSYVQADPYYKNTPEGFSVYGKAWLSPGRLHEYIYLGAIKTLQNSKEEINYDVLSKIANRKISNINEAISFLTSDAWLNR